MSFILVGFGKRKRRDLGEIGHKLVCIRCNNSIIYHLINIHTWFTCFFIPIFSYRSEHKIVCPICRYSIRLRDAEIKAARQGTLNIYLSND